LRLAGCMVIALLSDSSCSLGGYGVVKVTISTKSLENHRPACCA
jgi:hypothetical protein